jgi:hypothetical protein
LQRNIDFLAEELCILLFVHHKKAPKLFKKSEIDSVLKVHQGSGKKEFMFNCHSSGAGGSSDSIHWNGFERTKTNQNIKASMLYIILASKYWPVRLRVKFLYFCLYSDFSLFQALNYLAKLYINLNWILYYIIDMYQYHTSKLIYHVFAILKATLIVLS